MERYLKSKLENGVFFEVAEKTSKTMSAIKGKNNKTTELKFRMLLVRNGITGWKRNYSKIKGKPDFYFPSKKIAVFVDGCFWHGCPKCGHIPKTRSEYWETKIRRNKERDILVTKENTEHGILVLRFWEHELKDKENINKIIQSLIRELEGR